MIKVALTDDHTLIRDGLKLLLENVNGIEVVGDTATGDDLLELLANTDIDVVLLDICMPGKDGFEITRQIKKNYPQVKVLVLSMVEEKSKVLRIMEEGATGYVLKSARRDELVSAINLVARGTRYICSDLSMDLLQQSLEPELTTQVHEHSLMANIISKRELEILSLIADGYTNAEIAEKLFTSKRTIETHRQNLLEKTKAKNTAHMIKFAMQAGIVS